MPDNPYVTNLLPEEAAAFDEAQKAETESFQSTLNDYATVFGTEAGLRVLYHMLDYAGAFGSVFTGNSQTYHNSGACDFANFVAEMVGIANPTAYAKIYQRHAEEMRKATGGNHG